MPECPTCNNALVEDQIVLLPCLHSVCENCKNDLLKYPDVPGRCFAKNCNNVFNVRDAHFFAPAVKRARIYDEAPTVEVQLLKTTTREALKDVILQIEIASPSAKLENLTKSAFEVLDNANAVIDEQIAELQHKKEEMRYLALQHIEASIKPLEILKHNVEGFAARAAELGTIIDSIDDNHVLPLEFMQHNATQALSLQQQVKDSFYEELNALPTLRFTFTAGVRPYFNLISGDLGPLPDVSFPVESPLAKSILVKEELFGDGWEEPVFKWLNPHNLVWINHKSKEVFSINPEFGNSVTHCVAWTDFEGRVIRMMVASDGQLIVKFLHGGTFPENRSIEMDFSPIISNYPFEPLKVVNHRSFISNHIFYYPYYVHENGQEIIHFSRFPSGDNENTNICFDLKYFVTPNLRDALIFDVQNQRAYPFNFNTNHTGISLRHYSIDEEIIGVFTAKNHKYLYVFLKKSPRFLRFLSMKGEELFAFERPQQLGDEDILSVTLISDTSYILETRERLYIF